MTESSPWLAPEGAVPPAARPVVPPVVPPVMAPGVARPAPVGSAAPADYPPPAAGPLPSPGWTPPPKPGLIPLRPLTLGNILGASFQVLRRNPRPTFGFSLVLSSIVGLVALVVVGFVAFVSLGRLNSIADPTSGDGSAVFLGALLSIYAAAIIPLSLALVTTAILQGIISLEVARGTVGERLKLRGLWRMARGRIGALIGWSFSLVGAIILAWIVFSVVIVIVAVIGGTAGVVIGVLLGIAGFFGVLVVAVWIGTRVSLVPSVLMLERRTLGAAIGRSWSLTVGHFWKTFGIQILVYFILYFVGQIITVPVSLVVGLGSGLVDPTNSNQTALVVTIIAYAITLVILLVFSAISSVVQSATASLIYIDLRMRKEGLDLELAKFVEARQAGDDSVGDPYLGDPYLVAAPARASLSPDDDEWP